MSVTRIQCEGCDYPLAWCECEPFDLDNCYDQAEADLLNYIYEIEKNKMKDIEEYEDILSNDGHNI